MKEKIEVANKNETTTSNRSWLLVLNFLFFLLWIDSFISTTDIHNWYLENIWTLISVLFLGFTYNTYRFSICSYFLICTFLCLHVYGSKYTYSYNPMGFWLQDVCNLSRNHYDRIVHFSFGFLLYYPLLEFLSKWVKTNHIRNMEMFLTLTIIISASSMYEILEWLFADVFFENYGISYLGTQGDIWDSQKDMFVSVLGATIALLLYWLHQRLLNVKFTK